MYSQTKENDLENLKKTAPQVLVQIYAAYRVCRCSIVLVNETKNVAENVICVINKNNCAKSISLGKSDSYKRRIYMVGKIEAG